MKRAVFIPVRLGSTRLPRKALIRVKGQSLIEHLIDRVSRAALPDSIVVCTTTLPEDSCLESVADRKHVLFFRGSSEDIISRYVDAADALSVQEIVNVDGDDIFCEPSLIDRAFRELEEKGVDYVPFRGLPIGAIPIAFTAKALRRVQRLKEETRTETGWARYFTETGLFKMEQVAPDPRFVQPGLRLTLDYPEDLEFATQIFDALYRPGKLISLEDIIAYVRENPEVSAVNSHLESKYKSDFARKQVRLTLKSEG